MHALDYGGRIMDRGGAVRAGGHPPPPGRTGDGPGFRRRQGPPPAGRTPRANRATRGRSGAARRLARSTVAAAGSSFAFAFVLVFVFAGAAAAHSRPEATAPANGEVVAEAPPVVAISFDEPMRVTRIELTNADGDAFALERTDEMAPVTRFEATPPPLPAGRYTVKWRGLSADGHPMSGRFSFEVRPRDPARAPRRTPPGPA